ncbi:hypothetical protein PENTCL1PPCAC_13459, partial [Pristionchus entomophagus]
FQPLIRIMDAWHGQCNFTLQYPGLMEQLASEKYDAAFSEPLCFCGHGIFEKLGIYNIASTLSTGSSEGQFQITGTPSIPSYVPGVISAYSDRMTFLERVGNTVQSILTYFLATRLMDPYDILFKRHYGEGFPALQVTVYHHIIVQELVKKTLYFFINSEPLT